MQSVEFNAHVIHLSDVEDPDLFVAQPIWEWQQTEKGKYIMQNSSPAPMWERITNYSTYGYDYRIKAYLTPSKLTYYRLKYE